jgi:hypothetical protein
MNARPFRITFLGCRREDLAAITQVVQEAGRASMIDLLEVTDITDEAFPKPIVHAVVLSSALLGTVGSEQERVIRTATGWGTFRLYVLGELPPIGSRCDDFVQRTPAQDATRLAHTIIAFFEQADAMNRLGLVRGLRDLVCLGLYLPLGLLWSFSYICVGVLLAGVGLQAAGHPWLWEALHHPVLATVLSGGIAFFLVHFFTTALRNCALVVFVARRVPTVGFFVPLIVWATFAGSAIWAGHRLGYGGQIALGLVPALGLLALHHYCRRIRAELASITQIQRLLETDGPQASELLDIGRDPLSSGAIPLRANRARQVFISYMHRSDWSVRTACECHAHLTAAGHPVFFDRSTIEPGSLWRRQLMRGLSECGLFVVVLDGEAEATSWVLSESVHAATLRKNVGKPRILLVVRNSARLVRGPFGRIYHDLFTRPEAHHPGIHLLEVPPEGLSGEHLLSALHRIRPLCILGGKRE